MSTALSNRKLRAEIVRAHLECAWPKEQTADEIGNACSMKKRDVQDALYLLGSQAKIEYGEHRAGGLTYKVAAMREP